MARLNKKMTGSIRTIASGKLKWKEAIPGADGTVLVGDPDRHGAEYVVRYRLQAGFQVPPHYHPNDEHITVISGKLLFGSGRKFELGKTRLLRPGDYAFVPGRAPHFTSTKETTVVQAHGRGPFKIIYLNSTPARSRRKM